MSTFTQPDRALRDTGWRNNSGGEVFRDRAKRRLDYRRVLAARVCHTIKSRLRIDHEGFLPNDTSQPSS